MTIKPEYQTVYVVVADLGEEDPTAFSTADDANAYADAINGFSYSLLVCDRELAAEMISEARGEEES